MSDMNRDLEMDFGAMLAEFEGSEVKLHRNAVVSAIVESVTAKEIIVSVPNCRYTGTVKASEFSADPSAKLEELVKKGDELTLIVIKTDDNAGEVQLSKKRLDEREGEGVVEAAAVDAIVYPTKAVEGKVAADTSSKYFQAGELTSKKALGDKYAMAPASPIGAEWDAQALAIETAAVGKTGEEITKLVAGEGDLAGATMTVTSYLTALANAAKYADLERVGPQA